MEVDKRGVPSQREPNLQQPRRAIILINDKRGGGLYLICIVYILIDVYHFSGIRNKNIVHLMWITRSCKIMRPVLNASIECNISALSFVYRYLNGNSTRANIYLKHTVRAEASEATAKRSKWYNLEHPVTAGESLDHLLPVFIKG